MNALTRQTLAGLRMILVMTVLLGIAYPLTVWAVAHLPGLSAHAEGSVITAPDGTAVGSSLIGIDPVARDAAADPYFHTRPSATAKDILGPGDPSTSVASNQAGDSEKLLKAVNDRRAAIAAREGVNPAAVPPDAVTASGSSVDPNISAAYAELQAARVARVTGVPVADVARLIAEHTDGRGIGILGSPGVDVTELNLAIARAAHGR